jgi:hypothetical protein
MATSEKITLEFSPNEFTTIWRALNNEVLSIYAKSKKKDLEQWKKKALKKEYEEAKKLQKFFGDVSKNFTINIQR